MKVPEDMTERIKEWADGEVEREKERETFMGKLQAVGKDPRAALDTME